MTTGSQQGFDLLLRVLVGAGDVVLVEQPAYPATLQALKLQQAEVVTLPVDQDGLDVAALAALLEAGTLKRLPKLLYTVPTFANPTARRCHTSGASSLLKLAARYRFLVVEDDPYGDLRFAGEALPSLLALSAEVPGSRDWGRAFLESVEDRSARFAGGLDRCACGDSQTLRRRQTDGGSVQLAMDSGDRSRIPRKRCARTASAEDHRGLRVEVCDVVRCAGNAVEGARLRFIVRLAGCSCGAGLSVTVTLRPI